MTGFLGAKETTPLPSPHLPGLGGGVRISVVVWAGNGHHTIISHYLVHCPASVDSGEVIRVFFVRVLVFLMAVDEGGETEVV